MRKGRGRLVQMPAHDCHDMVDLHYRHERTMLKSNQLDRYDTPVNRSDKFQSLAAAAESLARGLARLRTGLPLS